MSSPVVVPEKFFNGPTGGTPLDADAMNRIWDALMHSLLDQLTPRRVSIDGSISMGEMLLVDASNGPVYLQAAAASGPGSQGARKIDRTSNPVYIAAVGTDVLDDAGSTTLTLLSAGDDVVLSLAGPGRFTLARRTSAPLPATATGYGTIKLGVGGDLVGPADAVTVPGKEDVGVARALIDGHANGDDPHGDRLYARSMLGEQIGTHSRASDPHGDRSWAQGQFVPMSWFDANGQLLPSHTGALAITSTSVVANQAAMLALNAQTGDIAIRTDAQSSGGQRTYILQGPDPTVLANWTVLPALGSVASVRGSASQNPMTGDVVLSAGDVGASSLAHALRHRPGGEDDISTQYVSWAMVGAAGGVAAMNDSRINGAQQFSQKGAANGYPGLDSAGRVIFTQAPTPVPSGPFTVSRTPVLGECTIYNAGNASITNTLPAAPTGTTVTVIEVRNITPVNSANTVTFNLAGTDTLDYATSPLVLRIYGETRRLVGYQGNWTTELGLNQLPGLDTRYLQIANHRPIPAGGAQGQALVKTGAADYAVGWSTISGNPLVPYPPIDLPFAASQTPNANVGNYRTTTATGDFTLNPPSNPSDGQVWRYRFLASGAQRTMTFSSSFRFPSVGGVTMSNTLIVPSGRRGDVALLYDVNDAAWSILSAQAQAA